MRVQRLARECEVRLAHCFGQRRMRVDETCDIVGVSFPVVDELALGQQLADAAADHMNPEHRPVLQRNELHCARGLKDLSLAVAGQVVGEGDDLVAVALAGGRLGDPDRRDLGLAVRDARNAVVVDRRHR